jgi:hypothetical protein
MADATVLNTVGLCPCGFESRLRHWADLQAKIRAMLCSWGGSGRLGAPLVTSW